MYQKRFENCLSCGKPLGRRYKFCGDLCKYSNQKKRLRERYIKKVPRQCLCKECKNPFLSKRKGLKYCGSQRLKTGCCYKRHLRRAGPRSRQWQKQHPEKLKEYREKHKSRQALYYRSWYAQNGRKRTPQQLDSSREWASKNKRKVKAQGSLRYAVKTGKITKPAFCQNCFRETKLHGHHENYSKPYDVMWLCASCHKIAHQKIVKSGLDKGKESL